MRSSLCSFVRTVPPTPLISRPNQPIATLRLDGVNSREHPVFKELARVRQYFEKIKQVEASGIKRENLSLDKEAANRFVKHALVCEPATLLSDFCSRVLIGWK